MGSGCDTHVDAEQDPRTRNTKLAQSLDSFTAAVGTHHTASAHHHLALALFRPGPAKDLNAAIEHARAAVEADPNEIRHWHLLGLFLAANGDWQASKQVLELGIGHAEADLVDDEAASQGPPQANGAAANLTIRDFVETVNASEQGANGSAINGHTNGVVHETILAPAATAVPPSATLLQPLGDRPLSNRQEKFEYALQARMTQLALTELVEGAEAVGDKWLEVFLWFREKRPAALDDRECQFHVYCYKLSHCNCRKKIDRQQTGVSRHSTVRHDVGSDTATYARRGRDKGGAYGRKLTGRIASADTDHHHACVPCPHTA